MAMMDPEDRQEHATHSSKLSALYVMTVCTMTLSKHELGLLFPHAGSLHHHNNKNNWSHTWRAYNCSKADWSLYHHTAQTPVNYIHHTHSANYLHWSQGNYPFSDITERNILWQNKDHPPENTYFHSQSLAPYLDLHNMLIDISALHMHMIAFI